MKTVIKIVGLVMVIAALAAGQAFARPEDGLGTGDVPTGIPTDKVKAGKVMIQLAGENGGYLGSGDVPAGSPSDKVKSNPIGIRLANANELLGPGDVPTGNPGDGAVA